MTRRGGLWYDDAGDSPSGDIDGEPCVFFVDDGQAVFVGDIWTSELHEALEIMQSMNSTTLRLLGWVAADRGTAQTIRKRLERRRVHGQWFDQNAPVLSFTAAASEIGRRGRREGRERFVAQVELTDLLEKTLDAPAKNTGAHPAKASHPWRKRAKRL